MADLRFSPSFSTRGGHDLVSRSRSTSWSKGLHYKSHARLGRATFLGNPIGLAGLCHSEGSYPKILCCEETWSALQTFWSTCPLFERLGGRFTAKNSPFWRRVEKVAPGTKSKLGIENSPFQYEANSLGNSWKYRSTIRSLYKILPMPVRSRSVETVLLEKTCAVWFNKTLSSVV